MKIGIYNRYWGTCGGGEKHIGAIAEFLSKRTSVELIAVEEIDWKKIESNLGLDFSKCKKVRWPNEACEELSFFSQKYDIFLNSTYNSLMYPRAKINVYMCFFPQNINQILSLKNKIKKIIIKVIGTLRYFSAKEKFKGRIKQGNYELESDGRIWFKDYAAFDFPIQNKNTLTFQLYKNSYSGINIVKVNNVVSPWRHTEEGTIEISSLSFTKSKTEITIASNIMIPSIIGSSLDSRRLGFAIDYFRNTNLKKSNLGQEIITSSPKEVLSKYDLVLSNSNFTKHWIKKRWSRNSHLIEPYIDTYIFNYDNKRKRKNIILNVGRFFSGANNKKQLEIVNFYKKLIYQKIIDDSWQLVLAGAYHKERGEHIDYMNTLLKNANGYNIKIMNDISFDVLLDLYKKSYIYIHASGFGENINLNPENFEHFGITTCEAMSCGCIPIVYDAAGQSEIVNNERVGFKYKNFKELKCSIKKVINMNEISAEAMRIAARTRILDYSKENFNTKLNKIFNPYIY